MTDDDIDTIEGQLGVTMPDEYRSLAPKVSNDCIFNTAKKVVLSTQQYRIQGMGEKPFPSENVIIGESGTGDLFSLDLSQDPAPVVEFDHERGRFKVIAFSFTSWVKRVSK
jgi:SMI1-KNR4 cell-wall